jgi:hypothetical protein
MIILLLLTSLFPPTQLLRLRLPAEVKVSESRCQRSKTTGSLLVIMPKVDPKENAVTIRGDLKAKARQTSTSSSTSSTSSSSRTTIIRPKKLSLQEQMLADAMQSAEISDDCNAAAATTTSASAAEAGSDSTSRQLLEVQPKPASSSVDIGNIVRKPLQKAEEEDTIFSFSKTTGDTVAATAANDNDNDNDNDRNQAAASRTIKISPQIQEID